MLRGGELVRNWRKAGWRRGKKPSGDAAADEAGIRIIKITGLFSIEVRELDFHNSFHNPMPGNLGGGRAEIPGIVIFGGI